MEIKGNRKIHAPRQQVFQALLNPEVLKNCIPGGDSVEFVDTATGRQIKLTISPNIPGFKGPYTVFLQVSDVVPPSHLVLTAEPRSSMGSVKAICAVDLLDEGADTQLNYNANAEREGKVAAVPEMLIKGPVKSQLDQFFKNFEKQISTVSA
jgi:carbon monoxide dehydrogenase subunit G